MYHVSFGIKLTWNKKYIAIKTEKQRKVLDYEPLEHKYIFMCRPEKNLFI